MDESTVHRLLAFARGCEDEQLRFVVELCNQNSFTYNPEGTNRVAGMVLDRLGGLFAQHEIDSQAEVGDHHILRTGQTSRAIYLLGHMDTVFPPGHDFQKCRHDGEWLIGPGTGDMKGGLAVIVYALKGVKEVGILDNLDIVLVLGADEEIGSATSQALYQRERERAAACLVAECGGAKGEIVVSRNGKAGIRLDCYGGQRHVGRVSGRKSSAILEMAHKIVALESLNGCLPGVTVNVGTVEGGLGPCTVPAHASCLVDMRWEEEAHYLAMLDRVTAAVKSSTQPGCKCDLTVLNHRPAMPLTKQTEKALSMLTEAAASLGIEMEPEHRRGTSDANYFGSAGVPTLDGLGPLCEDDHTSNERIFIPSLASRTALLALFLARHGPALQSPR
jgi:glutamate carboxypeptidase